jgi:cytochrome c
MPDLLRIADRGRDRDVDHLVNFLSSLGGPLKPGTLPVDAAMVEEGRKLYHTIGCVACHDAEKGVGEPTSGGVPIEDIWTKTTVEKLAEFLRDPLKTRPSGRMPSLWLSDRESVAIAAYLCRKQEPNNFRGPPGMADFVPDAALIPIGKRMFINLGCADCHKLEGYKSKVFAPTFSRNDLDVRSGCLDWHVPRGLPMYQLTDAQIEAIRAALDSEQREHWGEPVPLKQQIAVTLGQLNCYACHSRDEVAGIEPTRLPYFHSTLPPETGVEGRIPPPLTGVGQRLNEQMLTEIMVNSRGFMRPFLLTRMPTFGAANVEPLVKQFIEADRAVRQPAVEAPGKPGG